MTSEVAVMNKEAIALAADSAVTFRQETGQKIFTSASKIFLLSKFQPVAVMFYGNANFMDIPWETIFKIYRGKLGERTFKSVGEYAQDFLSFLSGEEQLHSDEQEEWYVKRSINSYFKLIMNNIRQDVEETLGREEENNDRTFEKLIVKNIQDDFSFWSEQEVLSTVPAGFPDKFRNTYGQLIEQEVEASFEKLPVSDDSIRKLNEISFSIFVKSPPSVQLAGSSGIVVAGFGTEELFPNLESFSVDGRIGNYLKHKKIEEECAKITFANGASIRSFAQNEMVTTFMAGVDPEYQNFIDGYVKSIYNSYPEIMVDNTSGLDKEARAELNVRLRELGQREFEKYRQKLFDYRHRYCADPIMSVVSALPKDELAAMAESLISLASLKKRVSMGDETVGGPVDVAVISKGDGFIWIKRKHYFEGDLNPHFFANYYRKEQSDDNRTADRAESEKDPHIETV